MSRELFNLLGAGALFLVAIVLSVVASRDNRNWEPFSPIWLVAAMVLIAGIGVTSETWPAYAATLPTGAR